ncbi:Transmembrane 9 superfamily member 1, partial [Bienertia sinuspersici]
SLVLNFQFIHDGDYLDEERDVSEESGWKLVHGDVFRSPCNLALLSAVVGIGAQFATLVLLVIILAIVGMLYIGYLDKDDDTNSFPFPILVLWHWVHLEHHCYILWISGSYSLRENCSSFCHLGFYLFPSCTSWHYCWKKLEWISKQSMSREDYPPTYS